ncbi:MAG: hypothetical protein ACJ74W_14145 [Pyrinomonadaceae bacterium]
MTLAAFLVLLCVMFALSRAAKSQTTGAANPAPAIPLSTDGGQTFPFDGGVVTPGPNQLLRVSVVNRGDRNARVRFAWMEYSQDGCSGGVPSVCRHMVSSQGASPPQTLMTNEALSLDVPGMGNGVRVIVESSTKNVDVLGQMIERQTGAVAATWTAVGVN